MRKSLKRNVILFMVVLLALAGSAVAQPHFDPVDDTGINYGVFVDIARIDGTILQVNDEIAVFDGQLCVGSVVLTEQLLVDWDLPDVVVPIVTVGADIGTGRPGYTEGNQMTFRIWSAFDQFETTADEVQFMVGDGNFGTLPFCTVNLDAQGPGAAELRVEPLTLDFGPVFLGNTSTLDIEIFNDGGMALQVEVLLNGEGFASEDLADFTVIGGNSQIYSVTFSPVLEMDYNGTVDINTNAGNFQVPLSGNGYVDRHFTPVDPTGISHVFTITAADIYYPETDVVASLAGGDEIAVYDGNLCVGSILLEEPVMWPVAITAYGDDELDENGFVVNNELLFRVFNLEYQRELYAAPTFEEGDEVFMNGGATTLSLFARFDNVTEFLNSVTILSELHNLNNGRWYRDGGNVAALDDFADDGYELSLDIPEPRPPQTNYLSTYFPHPEWESLFGDNFMVDVRDGTQDLTNDLKIYDFDVKTDIFGPPVNLTFTIGEDYNDDYGVVLHHVVDDVDVYQDLREDDTYSFNTIAGQRTYNLALQLGDATPPVIDITYPAEGDTLWTDVVYMPTWTIDDITYLRNVTVYYSTDNGDSWTEIASLDGENNGPTTAEWVIDPDLYSVYTKLKVYAKDWAGNESEVETDYTFNVAPRQRSFEFSENWQILSLPIMLDETDVDNIFGNIGPFWVYDYSADAGYDIVQDIFHGPGYWLAMSQQILLEVEGMPELISASLDLVPDWNLVGTALPTTISKYDLMFTMDGEIYYDFTEAVNERLVGANFFNWDNDLASYTLTDDLDEWYGYWLQVLEPGVQMVTYPPFPGPHAEGWVEEEGEIDEMENGWFIPIVAIMEDATDHLAGFGAHDEATDGYDVWHDVQTPPVSAQRRQVRVVFDHSEWNEPTGSLFSRDIRSNFLSEEVVWNGVVEADREGLVTVTFEDVANQLPQGYGAKVIHAGGTLDLRNAATFSFNYSEPYPFEIRVYDLTSVKGEYSNLPSEFKIVSAYPNPFNPTVNVKVALPQAGRLTATVYDLMGREVAVLESGMVQAGYHDITWQAEGTSGIYFMRVNTDNGMQAIQKLMFLK